MRAEFDRDSASALHPKEPARFTPLLKQTLAHAVDQCVGTRTALVDSIEREPESLHRPWAEINNLFASLGWRECQSVHILAFDDQQPGLRIIELVG